MSNRPKRYSLNSNQLHVLKLLYKFRFVDTSFLARYKGISRISANKTLKVLLDQHYLGSYFKPSFTIHGRGPTYYLAPKALTYLRDNFQLNEQVLHAMYKNKTVSQSFIDHNLAVARVFQAIQESYPNRFHIFTKAETVQFDHFPDPRPDLFLSRIDSDDNKPNEYFINIFTDTLFYGIKLRFDKLLEHYDEADWDSGSDTPYPTILMVCSDSRVEANLQAHIAKKLENAGIEEINVYTTTKKALLASDQANPAVWSSISDSQKLLSL